MRAYPAEKEPMEWVSMETGIFGTHRLPARQSWYAFCDAFVSPSSDCPTRLALGARREREPGNNWPCTTGRQVLMGVSLPSRKVAKVSVC